MAIIETVSVVCTAVIAVCVVIKMLLSKKKIELEDGSVQESNMIKYIIYQATPRKKRPNTPKANQATEAAAEQQLEAVV